MTADTVNTGVHALWLPQKAQPQSRRLLSACQLIVLLRGEGHVLDADGQRCSELSAGQLVLLNGSRGFRLRLKADSHAGVVGMEPAAIRAALLRRPSWRSLFDQADPARLDFEPQVATLPALFGVLVDSCHESSTPVPVITGLLDALLSWLPLPLAGQDDEQAAETRETLVKRFETLLAHHLRERWNVQDYAEALDISADRLYQACRALRDCSPQQLLHRQLYHEACRQLEQTPLSVRQIALRLGFADSAQFSHFFKLHNGLAPSHYRRQLKTGNA